MEQEINNNTIITYDGVPITLWSDEEEYYIDLTEMAKAWKSRKSILTWIRNRQTVDFMAVWERKHNIKFSGAHLSAIYDLIKERTLTIKKWIDLTDAKGIRARVNGTFAHKDIAIRFAAWLSPEFELFLVEKFQELTELERKKNSLELLTHEQVLGLIQLKEVFKYVSHQAMIEEAHKEVFASRSNAKNPFAEFNSWRNKILEIDPETINKRIKEYCIERNIALTPALLRKSKHEKILILDSYDSVRNAVWDFLQIRGEINALSLANLVGEIIRTEKGEVIRENADDLFRSKENLGSYTDFQSRIGQMKEVKSARQLLAERKEQQKQITSQSGFNQKLTQALNYNPKDKGK